MMKIIELPYESRNHSGNDISRSSSFKQLRSKEWQLKVRRAAEIMARDAANTARNTDESLPMANSNRSSFRQPILIDEGTA